MQELASFPHVVEAQTIVNGSQSKILSENARPVTLELGCGRGDYTRALACKFPAEDFLGVDIKGARLWQAATAAIQEGLSNVKFIRARIHEIAHYIESEIVDAIWLPFPDPFPKKQQARRRLTSPEYLRIYKQLLKPRGLVHLKTDDVDLYNYTIEALKSEGCDILVATDDVHRDFCEDQLLGIKTTYERRHLALGKTIKYVEFRFKLDR